MSEDAWYSERRTNWRPDSIRLLLIAESAPDAGNDLINRRFFYDGNLTAKDGLFREVVRALYGNPVLKSGKDAKLPWLQRLRTDGVYLIDLAPVPVNYQPNAERAAVLKSNIEATISHATELRPTGVALIKRNVFDLLHRPTIEAGLPLLHDAFIPFPGSGQQKRFRECFAAAVANLPAHASIGPGPK